jgi:hypothetical protein
MNNISFLPANSTLFATVSSEAFSAFKYGVTISQSSLLRDWAGLRMAVRTRPQSRSRRAWHSVGLSPGDIDIDGDIEDVSDFEPASCLSEHLG